MQNCSKAKLMPFLVSYWTLAGACANHTHIAANRGPSRAPGRRGAAGAAAGNSLLPRPWPACRELELRAPEYAAHLASPGFRGLHPFRPMELTSPGAAPAQAPERGSRFASRASIPL